MKLFIIRHGETVENAKGVCMGQIDGKLSFRGIKQASQLARYFKKKKIDIMYSSDLRRCVDTANWIVCHKEIPLLLDVNLRERYYGIYQGKKWKEVMVGKSNITNFIESTESIRIRVKIFLDSILAKHSNQTVAIVCHSGVIKVLLMEIFNFDKWPKFLNASISELIIDNKSKNPKKIKINYIKHLK